MRALRVNQNGEVVSGQINNELKLTVKLCKAEPQIQLIINYKNIAALTKVLLLSKLNHPTIHPNL